MFLRLRVCFSKLRSTLLILTLSTCLGCGGSGYPAPVPVSGKITVSGKPVAGGTIHFTPVDSKKSLPGFAEIQKDGSYVATTTKAKDGLTPGDFNVWFDPPADGNKGTGGEGPIPQAYLTPGTSGLTKTIDAKGGAADFDLKPSPPL